MTLSNEIDFVLVTVDDGNEDPYKVIIPTMDGKPMAAALSVEDSVQPDHYLPVIFKDSIGRQSLLTYVQLIDGEKIEEYKKQVEDHGDEQIGKIDEESIELSIQQARKNLLRIKTPDAKAQGDYLKSIKRQYKKQGVTLHNVSLDRYNRIISMIPDISGTDLAAFKVPAPDGEIVDAWESEDEAEAKNEAVYVILASPEDEGLKTDKEATADAGNNDIDILISGFNEKGMELVDEVAIHVVMNDKDYTELIIDETPELKAYKEAKEIDSKIRVVFIDDVNKICSQPTAALVLHTVDKSNNFDSVNEEAITLTRENAEEFELADHEEDKPNPITLNKYTKVDKLEIVSNKEMADKVVDEKLLELGVENSVLMISVSAPVGDRIRKTLLLL